MLSSDFSSHLLCSEHLNDFTREENNCPLPVISPCCLETQRHSTSPTSPRALLLAVFFLFHSCCELITATLFSGAPAPRTPEEVAPFRRLVPLQFCNRGDFSSAPQPAVIAFNPTLTSFPAADPLLAEAMNQSPRAGDSWHSAGQEGCRKTSVY